MDNIKMITLFHPHEKTPFMISYCLLPQGGSTGYDGPFRRKCSPISKKSQHSLNGDDMIDALRILQSRSEDIFGKHK